MIILYCSFGSAVIEFMADQNYSARVVRLGIPDEYIQHGTQQELCEECGYDAAAIAATVKQMLNLSEKELEKASNH